MTHVGVSKLTIIVSDNGLGPTNQWWNIVDLTPRNTSQWNINQNPDIFIPENAFGNVVRKMAAILSQPQCIKQPKITKTYDTMAGQYV